MNIKCIFIVHIKIKIEFEFVGLKQLSNIPLTFDPSFFSQLLYNLVNWSQTYNIL